MAEVKIRNNETTIFDVFPGRKYADYFKVL